MPTDAVGYNKWWNTAVYAGYAIFWSGISVGLTNLGSGSVAWTYYATYGE